MNYKSTMLHTIHCPRRLFNRHFLLVYFRTLRFTVRYSTRFHRLVLELRNEWDNSQLTDLF